MTGEHALKGDGRKGGWKYKDAKGNWHFTHGKTPNRTLQRAFDTSKGKIKKQLERVIGGKMK